MASTSDFKTGLTIEVDGAPVRVQEFLHVKPGKGAAFVRSKLKNLITGNTVEKTFRAGEPITLAQVERLTLQFTYDDGTNFCFMDTTSFEEVQMAKSILGDKADWLQEGMQLEALQWTDRIIDVSIPRTMVLTVTQTDPGVKGNTAQGGSKPATLETGVVLQVPLFINEGEKIKVDTEERKYMERSKE
ncbi:elongation factor P (EF-P) KOW-like domain-containing protein [Tribonema minus]|uniref:Elongation factor P (EF-P) KOW-like domain-containing protein n=1 Tax=Tribonema minus TaxID=303371 RepID=A0A836CK22_9STRA|nr:elongation factor P (EF-P) KOW-like domain-containing protein [Tribonema minus]